ncbi:hypothetical protein, partial [Agrobacterium vitis]|uniref:hypothetical protein n=1 Tax=Agrobacterium vitis TaxID=373 RepID=UPI001AEDD8E7
NCVSNDLWRKTLTFKTDSGCLHRRNLRPTRNVGNSGPVNVTTRRAFLISTDDASMASDLASNMEFSKMSWAIASMPT